jgi:hypothetical protein
MPEEALKALLRTPPPSNGNGKKHVRETDEKS